MSKDQKSPAASMVRAQAPKNFVNVSVELPMYSPETCEGLAAQGKLVDHIDMPDAKDDNGLPKAWSAIVLQATAPTIATTLDGEVVEIKIGDKFTIGMGKALEDLARLAENREFIFEVWLLAGEKRKIKGTPRTFVPWEISVNPVPEKRPTSAFSLRAYAGAPAALPAAGGSYANHAATPAAVPVENRV